MASLSPGHSADCLVHGTAIILGFLSSQAGSGASYKIFLNRYSCSRFVFLAMRPMIFLGESY